MKKMIALLLALVMAFALVACGGQENNQTSGNEEGSDKILIGAIYRDLTQTWFEKESTAAKATADELGIDILIGDGQEDPAVLIDVLDSFITQGIQGLVINTCDQGLSQTILDKCAAAGIPVCAVDVPLIDDNGTHIAPAVILDSYLCGQQTVEWLLNYVEENGGMKDPATTGFLILAMETATSCIPRADGQYDYFTEKCPDFPAANIFRVDYGAGSTETGYDAAAATAREGISHRMVNIAAADLARQKLEPLPMNHIRLAPEKVRRISSSFPQTNCRHLLMLFSSSRISFSVLYIRVSSQS